MEIDERFIEAVIDYHYLAQRDYPPKGFLMLVGKVIDHFEEISNLNTGKKINFRVSQTVDNDLISLEKGIVVTSDSEIIDRSNCRILDLARHLLHEKFQPEFSNLNMLIHS